MRINIYVPKDEEESFRAIQHKVESEGGTVSGVVLGLLKESKWWPGRVEESSGPERASAAIQAPRGRRERMGVEAAPAIERAAAVPEMTCRGCGHGQHVHTNQAVSSGTGCVWMGCACRGFRV